MGSERSGGNLLTQMMNAHSKISAPSPSHLVRTLFNNYRKYGDLNNDDNWNELVANVAELCNSQLGEWSTTFNVTDLSNAIVDRTPCAIIRHIYHVEAQGLSQYFIKENKTYDYFDEVLNSFPNCKFIYLIRDPRDVVLSHLKSPNHDGDIAKAAELWNEEQNEFSKILNNHGKNVISVTYEDLINQPEAELKRVCDFIDVDFDDNMSSYHKSEAVQNNAKRITDWKNLGSEVMKNNSRKFENELGADQIQLIEEVCITGMAVGDYQPLHVYPKEKSKEVVKRELASTESEIRNKRLQAVRKFVERGQVV